MQGNFRTGVILLGANGIGKGRQAELLAKRGATVVSTGELCRAIAKDPNSHIGKRLKAQAKHKLVDNDIIFELLFQNTYVFEAVLEPSPDIELTGVYVFDGVPRSIEQATWLDSYFEIDQVGISHLIVLHMTLPPEKLLACVLERCKGRGRDDDDPVTVQRRLALWQQHEPELLQYYAERPNTVMDTIVMSGEVADIALVLDERLKAGFAQLRKDFEIALSY